MISTLALYIYSKFNYRLSIIECSIIDQRNTLLGHEADLLCFETASSVMSKRQSFALVGPSFQKSVSEVQTIFTFMQLKFAVG